MFLLRSKHKLCSFFGVLLIMIGLPTLAAAGAKIKIDDTKYFQIGMGYRGSISLIEDNAPTGKDASFDLQTDNLRLYTVSQVHKNIQVEFNTELATVDDWTGGGTIETDRTGVVLLDAVAKVDFGLFEFWLGRQLPPSDRFNLDGPFYLNAAYSFPIVQDYPNIFAGRDNGAAIHGDVNGGKFKWAYGAFEGRTGATSSDQQDRVMHAARLDFALGDPEPGFYTGSTYFGAKKLTTIGFVYMSEEDGVGTSTDPGDYTGMNVDFLIERTLGNGAVVDLEGAYFDYDTDNKADASRTQGESFLILASYLAPKKTSIGGIQGKLQPYFRYQGFNRDMKNITNNTGYKSRTEAGINYVIDGFNAKITGLWYVDEGVGNTATNTGMLAMQFQL